ncbi:hypothetical protein L1887_06827 [Cichorium endivia]|nr:hypothetical protein L1887_06827 [Cichorium endivia]
MRIIRKNYIAILLLFFLFIKPSAAEIISLELRSDNRHLIPLIEFEFSSAGYVSFAISSVSVTSTLLQHDFSRMGFLLQSPDGVDQYRMVFLEAVFARKRKVSFDDCDPTTGLG